MRKYFVSPLPARRVTALTLLLCVAPLCGSKAAAGERRVKQPRENRRSESREIEGLEEQWRTAIVNGDAAVMEKLLSDDFLAISARGTLADKEQYLHRIAIHATQFKTFDLVDLKVRLQSGSAISVSQARIAGVLEGHPIEGTFRYTKVYTRAGGAWRMTNFEATRVSSSPMGSEAAEGMFTGKRPSHRRDY